MLKFPIFMDSQSTTPVDPRVVEAMIPYFTEKFGHPASRNHSFGWEAENAVDRARDQIAKIIGARDPKEVIFTSGGTESINLAVKGVAEMYREKGNHIVTTAIEQRASLDVGKRLERQGFETTYVPVRTDGLVELDAIREAITDKTILISVMFANNEIGTIQDMAAEGARLAKLRDRLQDMILSNVDEAYLNGHPERRLPHNLNISFAYVEGESVLMGLNKESALSSGSACTSSTLEPSYVIGALGASAELAHSSIRFSLHRFTTEEEVEHVGARTIDVVKRLREMSPLYELAKEGVDLKSIRWKAD